MWFIYAFSAAIIWGVSYAASGRAIERGVSPIVFFTMYTVSGAIGGLIAMAASGQIASLPATVRNLGPDWKWLAIAVVASSIGSLLIYMAIGEKNATIASLVEISYPLFVAIFAWVFFREMQFNTATICGAAMILGGVAVVFLANRG